MAHDIKITATSKEDRYKEVIKHAENLINKEDEIISILANISSLIHYAFNFWWTGFYLVKKDYLYLGPFQGPIACTTIKFGRGVCGTAWKEKKIIVVDDVNKFPGHIACSSFSKSEIVVPIFYKNGDVFGVLDIDSEKYSNFDSIDEKYLKIISDMISEILS